MKQTYAGGCQCGKVRYEVALDLANPVVACNCSRCGKLGSLLAFAPASDFKLVAGEGATTDYQFNKRAIHHLFCAACGIESFATGQQGGADMVAVNVRCLDGVDADSLTVQKFDGRNL